MKKNASKYDEEKDKTWGGFGGRADLIKEGF